VTIAKYI